MRSRPSLLLMRNLRSLAVVVLAIDGLWLELSLDASSFGADAAAAMVERAVAALI